MALGLIDRLRRRRDPVQKAAQEHLYKDRSHVTSRIEKFKNAPPDVQRQVLIELDAVSHLREPGARGHPMIAIIAALTAARTLLTSFFLSLLGSAITVTPIDPKTGEMSKRSFKALESTLDSTLQLITTLGVAFIVASLLAWIVARDQDHERTQAKVWSRIFQNTMTEMTHAAEKREMLPRRSLKELLRKQRRRSN